MKIYDLKKKRLKKKEEKKIFKSLNFLLENINNIFFSNNFFTKFIIRKIYYKFFTNKKIKFFNYLNKKKRIKIKNGFIKIKEKKKSIFYYICKNKNNKKKIIKIRFYEKYLIKFINIFKIKIFNNIKKILNKYKIKIYEISKIKNIRKKIFIYFSSYNRIIEYYNKYRLIKNSLVESNIRLVISISKLYSNKGVNFKDIVQEGILGLYKSIDKFDYKKGFKFSTYSTWWIKQSISRSISDHSRIIRIPVHMNDLLNKIKKISNLYSRKKKREIKNSYISEKLEIKKKKIDNLINISKNFSSFEDIVYSNENTSYKDIIEDKNEKNFELKLHKSFCSKIIEEILNTLKKREKEILIKRFGLFNNKCHTLEEIGKIFGITRERVRQIEAIAIKRLKKPSILRIIKKLIKGR
ncbi:sigma-70 family RNA polymerase sigma factor [Candidatus Vidania fulgoroideorum]